MDRPEEGKSVECPSCGHRETWDPWKDCPNRGCDGTLRAHHSYTSGGYKAGRLACDKCGSTVNFTAKVENAITPGTDKNDRPPGVIALMNSLVGREGEESAAGPFFRRIFRKP